MASASNRAETAQVTTGTDGDDVLTGGDVYQANATPVSVTPAGTVGDAASYRPVMSGDGKFVLFTSQASNLVAGDTAGTEDLFMRNLETGETLRVNVDGTGNRVNVDDGGYRSTAADYVFSPDNTKVYFVATEKTPTNSYVDYIYVRDLITNTLTKVPGAAANQTVGVELGGLQISADGRTLYYGSNNNAEHPGAAYTNNIYSRDIITGQIKLLSGFNLASNNSGSVSGSGLPFSVSDDGRWLVFSSASRLSADDVNDQTDFYLRNLVTGETRTIASGFRLNGTPYWTSYAEISADGKKIVFISKVPDIAANANGTGIFVMDVASGAITTIASQIDPWAAETPVHFVGNTHLIAYVGQGASIAGVENSTMLDLLVTDIETLETRTVAYNYRLPDLLDNLSLGFSGSDDGSRLALATVPNSSTSVPGTHIPGDKNGAADVIVVDPRQEAVLGGNDTLIGGNGNDTLYGLGGNDRLEGGSGNDRLIGGRENDTLIGGAGDDVYVFDTVKAFSGEPRFGAFNKDTVIDSEGLNTILITGGATEADIIYEVVGNDLYIAVREFGYPEPTASQAQHRIRIVDGIINPIAYIQFDGSPPRLVLNGTAGNDTLSGDGGDDRIDGGAGADTLNGRSGHDTYFVDNVGDVVAELSPEGIDYGGTDTVYASVDFTLHTTIERLRLSGTANINGTGNGSANWLIGNSGNNTLIGLGGDDLLAGGAGDDRLEGGDGADTLLGGAGADQLIGGAGNDTADYSDATTQVAAFLNNVAGNRNDAAGDTYTGIERLRGSAFNDILGGDHQSNSIYGGDGNDYLYGYEEGDSLYGGDGDDILEGGAGSDGIDGGAGYDIASYRNATKGIIINTNVPDLLNTNAGEALGDRMSNIEAVWGSDFADTIVHAFGAIYGFGGDDRLTAYSGDEYIDGGTGADTLIGGAGNDTYVVDNVGDVVIEADLQGANDLVLASINYTLGESVENLTLTGTADLSGIGNVKANILRGNAGNNSLRGGGGNDTLFGGDGDDTAVFTGRAEDYTIVASRDGFVVTDKRYGGDGSDILVGIERAQFSDGEVVLGNIVTLPLLKGTSAADIMVGSDDSERLEGGDGDDYIVGRGGNDLLMGGIGGDILLGDTGNDRLYGEVGNDHLYGGDGNDILYGGADADRLIGGAGADRLNGEDGDDVMFGEEGDDVLEGGDGYAYLHGGDGDDIVRGGRNGDFVIGGNGIDQLYGGDDSDQLYGDAGNDSLFGENGDDFFAGGTGNDQIYGGAGNDTAFAQDGTDILDGGDGNDNLYGQGGSDTLYGGSGDDLLMGGDDSDALEGGLGKDSLYGESGDDTLSGQEDDDLLVGGVGKDILYGGTGNDVLYGQGDNDTIYGDAGNDSLIGGQGNDILRGGDGDDFLTGEDSDDSIWAGAGNDVLYGGEHQDTLFGEDGNDFLFGQNGEDTLYGGFGSDVLDGGAHNDRIEGGADSDTVTGGGGADIFVFSSQFGTDTVRDFNAAEGDRIQLTLGSASLRLVSGTNFFAGSGVGPKTAVVTVYYDTDTGILYYDGDGTGSEAAIQLARFDNKPSLSADHFVYS
ncbi:hypothetical protein [Asticcacaulis excentricus]|nr:hypothetical protein [Asticcacaulis excentricus]